MIDLKPATTMCTIVFNEKQKFHL